EMRLLCMLNRRQGTRRPPAGSQEEAEALSGHCPHLAELEELAQQAVGQDMVDDLGTMILLGGHDTTETGILFFRQPPASPTAWSASSDEERPAHSHPGASRRDLPQRPRLTEGVPAASRPACLTAPGGRPLACQGFSRRCRRSTCGRPTP